MKRIKGLIWRFQNSQFVAHISFLWHWKNFFFLLRNPFYRVYNRWTRHFCGYAYTEYDSIASGWRTAFGKQLTHDIREAGKASRRRIGKHLSWKEMLFWEQIKEKWGALCLYASTTQEIRDVLDKYEIMSECYCIYCGKPARYKTHGWVEYYCEDCMREEANRKINNRFIHNEDFRKYSKFRLTKKDIPHGVTYTQGKNGKLVKHKIDYKKKYDVDFEELWDLKK